MPRCSSFLLLVLLELGCSRGATTGARPSEPLEALPAHASARLRESLAAASDHERHVWRDTPPLSPDGTLRGYIEISRGERTKWEFSMAANQRAIDRVIDASVAPYPVNYGFVPQTISFDGDPFDILVLGPPIEGGALVSTRILGLLDMDDEKGPDMKVVASPIDAHGAGLELLTPDERARIGDWFATYKKPEAGQGKWSAVHGWGGPEEGRALVDTTHRFFLHGVESGASSPE